MSTGFPEGIDISAHNRTPNFTGLSFVFVRASYGLAKDSRYDQHAAAAWWAGLPLGAYCFGRAISGKDQANRLLEIAPDADLHVLDREADKGHPTMSASQAYEFVATLERAGKLSVLYASESGYPADAFGADLRWIANWSRMPKIPWTFWQYKGTGLDRDRFNGTVEQLHALIGWTPIGSEDPLTNLVPLMAHRVVDLPAGTVLEKTPGGDPYTTLPVAITLGLLGATATHYHVADGDYGVYVPRALATVRTQDMNVGK